MIVTVRWDLCTTALFHVVPPAQKLTRFLVGTERPQLCSNSLTNSSLFYLAPLEATPSGGFSFLGL